MEAPPLPIPNREVKLHSADGTTARWESRSPPTPHSLGPIIIYSRAFVVKYEGCCERTTSGQKKRNKKVQTKFGNKKQSLTFATASQGKRLEIERDAGMEDGKSLKKANK